MKKIISILTVLCILVSAMPAFAYFADNVAIPETGVLCFHDFENYSPTTAGSSVLQVYTGDAAAGTATYWGGNMYNANVHIKEADGNIYVAHAVNGAALKYGIRDRGTLTPNNKNEYFASGVLKLAYDVLVPETTNTAAEGNYMYYYTTNNTTNGNAYLNQVTSNATEASINFSTKLLSGARPSANEVTKGNAVKKVINNNQWYNITMVVDYETNTVSQFLDGELVASYEATASEMKTYQGFSTGGMKKDGGESNANTFMRIDNFLVERVAKYDVEANVVNVGTNYVDVEFGKVVDSADVTAEAFSLTKLDGTATADATSVTKLSNYKYRVNFEANFVAASKYELVVNGDINEAGTPNKVAEGTKLLFNTEITDTTEVLVYNGDNGSSSDTPDNYDLPKTTEAAAKFTKCYFSGDDGTNDFATSTEKLIGYASISSNATVTPNIYRAIVITHTTTTKNNEHASLVIPFTNGVSVSSGIIEVEFNAAIRPDSSGWLDMAFGLRDKAHPETTYAYDTAWADATQFMGLINARTSYTMSDNTTKNNYKYLVPGAPEAKGRPVTLGKTNTEDGTSPYWNSSYALATVDEKAITSLYSDKYKFVVDLDNDFFEVYYNDNKVYTSDYMPGRVNDGVYDAFVLTSNYWNAARSNCMFFDNLKVTHRASALNLDSAAFEVGGEKVAYNKIVDFSADKMTITMKENVGTVNPDLVKLSGRDNYEVSADGKVITLSFPNGLKNETDYTVTLDSTLASTNGATLGSDVVLTFKTVTGEITYQTPVVDISNASLTAGDVVNVSVNAKRGIECSATIVIAAYKGDTLADVAFDVVTDNDGVLNFEYTVTEKFAGADVVKVFVLDNLTDITPYTANFSIGE